jgi:hypothetical protein
MEHATGGAWYAINTSPGQENAVERRLKRSGHDVLLPERKVRRRFRRVTTITKGPALLHIPICPARSRPRRVVVDLPTTGIRCASERNTE